MAKAHDYFPCVLRNALAFISSVTRPLLCSQRIGPLVTLSIFYFAYFYFPVAYIKKPPKKLSFSACSNFLLRIAYQYLLLLVGFDTLTYRKRCNRSLTVEGHQVPFSGAVAGERSAIGKVKLVRKYFISVLFIFLLLLLFVLWTTVLLDRCLRESTPHLWWLLLPLLKLCPIKYQLVLSIMFWL